MITLTTPRAVNTVLGGATTVNYDKLVLGPFTMDPVNQTITGAVRLTSTANPNMQPIIGTFRVSVPASEFVIEVPQLDFLRRVVTNSGQNTAILNQIEAAQAQIENGVISLGVIDGTRSAGA
jgi:hypothetical protein